MTPIAPLHFGGATVGGTFGAFHAGHRQYLDSALRLADFVTVQVTTDRFAQGNKSYSLRSFDERVSSVRGYLAHHADATPFEIVSINSDEEVLEVASAPHLDVAIVESAYVGQFHVINLRRHRLGVAPLTLILKRRSYLAVDGELSSTAVVAAGVPQWHDLVRGVMPAECSPLCATPAATELHRVLHSPPAPWRRTPARRVANARSI